ncbi:MAG TPA: hypothetical protein VM433_05900 [Mycobacteriales bacterium]|nr:hypothetical protein [Mycobacteriales bacterium]
MLDLLAAFWLYALAATTAMFVGVVVVQGLVRRVREVLDAVHRSRRSLLPAAAPVDRRELASSGRAA